MAETVTPNTPDEVTAPAAGGGLRRILAIAGSVLAVAGIAAGAVLFWQDQQNKELRLMQIAAAETLRAEEAEEARIAAEDTRALTSANLTALVEEEIKAAEARIAAAKKNVGSGNLSYNSANYTGSGGSANLMYWRGINSDVKAWLRIPGTNINCPVLQSASGDHYYQHRDVYGNYTSRGGAAWTQTATRFGGPSELSSNTVIYGHNWNNCRWNTAPNTYYPGMSQFEALMSYHYTNWAQAYPYIYYSTAGGDMTFVIFACFYTEGGDWYIYSEPSVSSLISEAQSRSRHTFNVDVNSSDKILTLSTCTRYYGNTANQRFVVMARLLRPGEGLGGVSATYNEYHRQPNVW